MFKRLGGFLLNSGIGIGGILIVLVLLELGVRGTLASPYDTPDTSGLVCSDQLGWRGTPNYEATIDTDGYSHVVKHNSVGMHDNEHTLAKSPQTVRIMMLGDSFVRAAHVTEAETSHQILENLLNTQSESPHFEVISSGMTGWGTGQQLLYYRREGRQYQPDVVLLMFYVGNDIQNNLPGNALTIAGRNCYAPYFELCEGQLDVDPWFYSPGLKAELGQCPFGRKGLATILSRLYSSSRLYAQIEPLFAVAQPHYNELPYYPLYIPEKNELFDYGWQLTITLIKQLHQEVISDGADFLIVLISPADVVQLLQMNPVERETIYQKIPELRQAQADRPHSRLTEQLAQAGIKVLDLQPLFIEHIKQTGETLYFSKDKHWNIEGNRLAGELIYKYLSIN